MTHRRLLRLALFGALTFLIALWAGACSASCSVGSINGVEVNGSDDPIVKSVTMTKTVKGDKLDPGPETTVFGVNDTVHAVVAIKNAPKGTLITASWSVVDNGGADRPGEFLNKEGTAEGTRNLDFDIKPNKPWPTGRYKVEIFLDGELQEAVAWSVR